MMKNAVVIGMCCLITVALGGCGRHHGHSPGHVGKGYGMERAAQEVGKLVDRTVQDPEKARQVKGLMQEILEEAKQSSEKSRELHRQLYELNSRYDATPEEFTKLLDDLNNARMRSASKILGLRFKMKELTTPEEWRSLAETLGRYRQEYRGARGHHDRSAGDRGAGGRER